MIDICELNYTGNRPEVWFRWKNVDMVADLDPGVINPVVIRGSAEGCEVPVIFNDYKKLQQEINRYVEHGNR